MSLATRCSACGTVFRVVQDQLKVSEGWVRCGRCHQVFNALEELFDLDRVHAAPDTSSAPVGLMQPSADLPAEAAPDAPPPAFADAEPADGDSSLEPPASEPPPSELPTSTLEAPSSLPDSQPDDDFADARFNTRLFADDEAAAARAEAEAEAPVADDEIERALDDADAAPPDDAAPDAAAAAEPAFVRSAERAARWRTPRRRAALAGAAVALAALLATQFALRWHDAIAARSPALAPLVAALCEAAGCTIAPPRGLPSISVDSSGLVRADGADAYRLSVVLRNHAEFALALPSVELSLTDSHGQVVARRVLAPRDFASPPDALPPLAETPLQLLLASDAPISGYSLELFYP